MTVLTGQLVDEERKLVLVQGTGATPLEDRLDRDLLRFVGWDEERHILIPERDNPYFGAGQTVCHVPGCGGNIAHLQLDGLCSRCYDDWVKEGQPDRELWMSNYTPRVARRDLCRIERDGTRCARISDIWGLCQRHAEAVLKGRKSLEDVLTTAIPFESLGECAVAACEREMEKRDWMLCGQHHWRWRKYLRDAGPLEFTDWCATSSAIPLGRRAVLRGLPRQIEVEVLYGLQRRIECNKKTMLGPFQYVVDWVRLQRPESIVDLVDVPTPKSWGEGTRGVISQMIAEVRAVTVSPDAMRHDDFWFGSVLGKQGNVDFRRIKQCWLREIVKAWGWETHLRHRNRLTEISGTVYAANMLSDYLSIRPDGGEAPASLGREDIVGFCNHLAILCSRPSSDPKHITSYARNRALNRLRTLLRDSRDRGLVDELPSTFSLLVTDIPPREGATLDEEPGKALPNVVLQQLLDEKALALFSEGDRFEQRRVFELIAHTGRRPSEITSLVLDCLRDTPEGPVLAYREFKSTGGQHKTLPISEHVADIIRLQQDRVVVRFPATKRSDLVLFPSPRMNHTGTKSITAGAVQNYVRNNWLPRFDLWGPGVDSMGRQCAFEKLDVYLYALRHSFAQRHADAGVPPDVLRELMGHRSMDTTQGYYSITDKRRRAAMDIVTPLLVDKAGKVLHGPATAEARNRLLAGRIAVPFGYCTEPSNVQAEGRSCPLRYQCMGCGHFRSDPSYIDELRHHLSDLKQQRAKLQALSFADQWAIEKASPADEEVARLERLIADLDSELAALPADQRAEVESACGVLKDEREAATWTPVQFITAEERRSALRHVVARVNLKSSLGVTRATE